LITWSKTGQKIQWNL